MEELQ